MKILVLGANGMAGHVITMYFQEREHQVTAFSRRKIDWCSNIVGDANNINFLKDCIIRGEYDAVINAVGLLNQCAETNKSAAVFTNSYLPHYLSAITENTTTKIIHMSTDCVFSGNAGAYKENSLRDGETFYDRSKALGELDDIKNLTFRNSVIGPDINENGIGLFNWFMKQQEAIKGFTKVIWTGVSTITLARAMEYALKENLTGVYHLVNNETITKYELLCLFNNYIRNGEVAIQPVDDVHLDKSQVNSRTDFSFVVPLYSEMVIEIKNWINAHKELYPHYFKRSILYE